MEEILLSRAKEVIVRSELVKKLKSGQKLRIKHGIDPTGPILHLGRASTLRRLRMLQEMGHQIVLIIGDFTARIGDASDKTSERQPLTEAQINANMEGYTNQLGVILNMATVELRYNSEWFNRLNLSDFIKLTQDFTVAQMIERENFQLRYTEQRPIGLHEFLYPVLQGYDSVAVRADVEIGGNDQLFNLMAGRVIQKNLGQMPQHVMTFDLLEGTDGRKMSTSWGNAIYINDKPSDMFGKLMSISDELIPHYYRICTDIEISVIDELIKTLAAGANPRDAKASLAREIVSLYHGAKSALDAEKAFNSQFRDKNKPSDGDIPVNLQQASLPLSDRLVLAQLVSSKTEARRKIGEGAVRLNSEPILEDGPIEVKDGDVLQVGKRRFVRIKIK